MSDAEQSPRERLLCRGAEAVTDTELLAICLGTGAPGVPVGVFAARLLARFGGLASLLQAPVEELLAQPGLGVARVALLKALECLVERHHHQELQRGPVFDSTRAVRGYLRSKLSHASREIFGCLFLDSRHRLIAFEQLFLGTVDRASVHPREVLRRALQLNAAAVILAHNHPSGVAEPSPSDIALTETLRELLCQIDVRVIDHLVVGRGVEVSFAERGLI